MCRSDSSLCCVGCSHSFSRRGFLQGCGAVAAGGLLVPRLAGAAEAAEQLLGRAGRELAPRLLDFYPAAVWEDQDECLEVRPEDVQV